MPVEWRIEEPVLLLRFVGNYHAEDMVQAMVEAMADGNFRPGLFLLGDGRDSRATLAPSDIDWRVGWLASLPTMGFSSRCAVVVRAELERFGIARTISQRLETIGVDLRLFREMEDAREWLTGERGAERA